MSADKKNEEWDETHAMDMVLNDMISQLRKVRVRFANEPTYNVIEDFKIDEFTLEKEFDYDLYGTYMGSCVMVNKEDYNSCI